MKKIIITCLSIFSLFTLKAQDITDALRYSQQEIRGTARYRAMSGAFGALGGDLSSLQINPAGSAVFLRSEAALTLSSTETQNDALYGNTIAGENSTNLNFNQIGTVFVYNNEDQNAPLSRFSLGLAYDQTKDNFDQLFIAGSSDNSISDYFVGSAQGLPLNLLTLQSGESVSGLYSFLGENEGYGAQQAFLGYESFVFDANDPNDLNNTSYTSNTGTGTFDQEYILESTGLNGKFTLNAGAKIHNNVYVGVNLNSHFISYDRITEFFERNNNSNSTTKDVIFTNRLSTIGSGVSAQFGAIAKLNRMIRVGFSYESPTWYTISEETTQRLETFREGADLTPEERGTFVVNPDIINIFPDYELRTPAIATGSLAILFNKQGLISIDYSYKDYSETKFSSNNGGDFSNQNLAIQNNLQAANTIRVGGEFRQAQWSYRGGFSFTESPYKNETTIGETTGVSFGLGYNFGKIKFDIAYDYTEQNRDETFFSGSDFTNTAIVDQFNSNLTFTLGLSL